MGHIQMLLAAVVILATISQANAITCRELLALDPAMGTSYVTGITDFTLFIETRQQSVERVEEYRACMERAGLARLELYAAVVSYIDTHPGDLDRPAATAVLNALHFICPVPYDPRHPQNEAYIHLESWQRNDGGFVPQASRDDPRLRDWPRRGHPDDRLDFR
jgi:hypothetical protein